MASTPTTATSPQLDLDCAVPLVAPAPIDKPVAGRESEEPAAQPAWSPSDDRNITSAGFSSDSTRMSQESRNYLNNSTVTARFGSHVQAWRSTDFVSLGAGMDRDEFADFSWSQRAQLPFSGSAGAASHTVHTSAESCNFVLTAILSQQQKIRQLELANEILDTEASMLTRTVDKFYREFDLFKEKQQILAQDRLKPLQQEFETLSQEDMVRRETLKSLKDRNDTALRSVEEIKKCELELKASRKRAQDMLAGLEADLERMQKSISFNVVREKGAV
jgi:hypothetical protein